MERDLEFWLCAEQRVIAAEPAHTDMSGISQSRLKTSSAEIWNPSYALAKPIGPEPIVKPAIRTQRTRQSQPQDKRLAEVFEKLNGC
jgi:hypothetical protein